jgi:fructokinase
MLLGRGDALINFLPVVAADERVALAPVAADSCPTVAVGMAMLGAPAGFVGDLSTELLGRLIADNVEASHVDLRHAPGSTGPCLQDCWTPGAPSTVFL